MQGGILGAVMGGIGIAVIIAGFLLIKALYKKLYQSMYGERDKAISEGKLAFSNGLSISETPYNESEIILQQAWLKGWRLGEKARKKYNV